MADLAWSAELVKAGENVVCSGRGAAAAEAAAGNRRRRRRRRRRSCVVPSEATVSSLLPLCPCSLSLSSTKLLLLLLMVAELYELALHSLSLSPIINIELCLQRELKAKTLLDESENVFALSSFSSSPFFFIFFFQFGVSCSFANVSVQCMVTVGCCCCCIVSFLRATTSATQP